MHTDIYAGNSMLLLVMSIAPITKIVILHISIQFIVICILAMQC